MPQSGYLLKFQSWTYAPIKTGEQFFSERPLPKELFPGKRPRLQGTKRWLPEKPALLQTNLDREVQRTEKNLTLTYIQGTQLPLVMSVLLSKKYLQNLMQTQVIQNLSQVGITNMAQRVATKNTLIAGRLHLFTQNWRAITQDPWVINSIQGYIIDLVSQPVQYQTPKELSFPQEETRSLTEEVVKMIEKGAISVVPREQKAKGFHSQLFCVPKKDGGKRPIINLKGLNSFVETVHFKMEGIHMLKDILRPGDWMTKVDLKDAYFMIPMAPSQRRLLRFQWQGTVYQFNCLPFGLSSAPWVFTKTTRPIMTILRTMGLRVIIYIDDILVMANTESLAREHTAGLIFLLENLGFIINYPKSLLTPTQEIEFLGLMVNSVTMEIKMPGEKIKQIRLETKKLQETNTCMQALTLSRLLGKLNHATQAIPPAPLFYRNLQQCLQKALATKGGKDYGAMAHLTEAARKELTWWQEHLTKWNGRCLLQQTPDMVIETDASTTGWGACCRGVRTGGPWSQTEKMSHINCLELLAAKLAVMCFAKGKRNILIHLKMDNTTALTYINKFGGTISSELNQLTKSLWTWCLDKNIMLQATHLAGIQNVTADEESRVMKDRTDWMLCPQIFTKINQITGPLQVDLFASRLTHQLRDYVSWRPDPEAMAIDAFTLDWTQFRGYANPPWNLVGRTLSQVRSQKAQLVLVAPVWKSQVWYPTLLEMLVQEPIRLPNVTDLIQPTHRVNKPDVTPPLAVWVISGIDSKTRTFQKELQRSSSHLGDRKRQNRMTPCLASGWAGVMKGVAIPFQEIYMK